LYQRFCAAVSLRFSPPGLVHDFSVCALATARCSFFAHGNGRRRAVGVLRSNPILWLAVRREASWRVAVRCCRSAYSLGQLGMLWPYYNAMGLVCSARSVGSGGGVHQLRTAGAPRVAAAFASWAGLVFPAYGPDGRCCSR